MSNLLPSFLFMALVMIIPILLVVFAFALLLKLNKKMDYLSFRLSKLEDIIKENMNLKQ